MKGSQEQDFKRTEVTQPNTVKELSVTNQSCFSSFLFSTLQIDLHGRTFLQEVLNPQLTVFDFSGLTEASHECFNGPIKDIKNEFITLLSLCDKRVSICSGYTC